MSVNAIARAWQTAQANTESAYHLDQCPPRSRPYRYRELEIMAYQMRQQSAGQNANDKEVVSLKHFVLP
uniref:Uncharacterized protein n=1 Tax=Panagrolaimus sp. ES5 TaxID=591445 RepID=A0AC34FSV2_9BILA